MSIIQSPGYGHPDWSSPIPQLYKKLVYDTVQVPDSGFLTIGPYDATGYGYVAGAAVHYEDDYKLTVRSTSTDVGGREIDILSFTINGFFSGYGLINVPIHGPEVYFDFDTNGNGATGATLELMVTNVFGPTPFQSPNGPLISTTTEVIAGTAVVYTSSLYTGQAMLAYQADGGGTALVEWYEAVGNWVSVYDNTPGTSNSDWYKDVVSLPAGLHRVTITTTATDVTCMLTPATS